MVATPRPDGLDLLIIGAAVPAGQHPLAQRRAGGRRLPAVAVVPRGAPVPPPPLVAIALEDGSAGDLIAFETRGKDRGRDARPITAEIVGRGRAVVR